MRLHAAPPARGLVPTLTLATFVNHLNVIAWNPFLPFIAAEIGVTVALLGQVPALMMLLATSLQNYQKSVRELRPYGIG